MISVTYTVFVPSTHPYHLQTVWRRNSNYLLSCNATLRTNLVDVGQNLAGYFQSLDVRSGSDERSLQRRRQFVGHVAKRRHLRHALADAHQIPVPNTIVNTEAVVILDQGPYSDRLSRVRLSGARAYKKNLKPNGTQSLFFRTF